MNIRIGRDGQFGQVLDVGAQQGMFPDPQIARILGVQQISDPFAVDLHVTDLDGVLRVGIVVVVDLLEEVLAQSRDDALVLLVLFAHHGVGLAGAGLAVREDAHVVAFEGVLQHLLAQV